MNFWKELNIVENVELYEGKGWFGFGYVIVDKYEFIECFF